MPVFCPSIAPAWNKPENRLPQAIIPPSCYSTLPFFPARLLPNRLFPSKTGGFLTAGGVGFVLLKSSLCTNRTKYIAQNVQRTLYRMRKHYTDNTGREYFIQFSGDARGGAECLRNGLAEGKDGGGRSGRPDWDRKAACTTPKICYHLKKMIAWLCFIF